MKWFGRSGGYYLFWTGAVYLTFGISLISLGLNSYSHFVAPVWILVLALPFMIPPFGRWLNMDVDWDKKMFDFFRSKTAKEYLDEASNVYNLPKPKAVPPMPEVKKEEPAKIFYRLGLTDNNRVAFSMGYSEITMNKDGCQQMIDQLIFFQSQLYDEDGTTPPDPDGGLPVPVPEAKAA